MAYNYTAARAAGLTDQEIGVYLASKGQTQQPQPQAQKGGFSNWLPTIGAVAGGFTPLGPVFGSGAGALVGTGVKQLIQGKGDAGELAKETAFAGLGAKFLPGILKGVGGKIAGKGAAAAKGVGGFVKEKAAQSVLNTSPSQFIRAEEMGIDLNQVYSKYAKVLGNRFDDMVGPVSTISGKGKGNLQILLRQAEDQIQTTVKATRGVQRLPGDIAVKALAEELGIIKNSVDTGRYNALKKIIDTKIKQDINGVPVSRALATARAANSKFGRSIIEEGEGSIANSADKIIANAYKRSMKSLYPELADALDTQHDLLTLEPILKFARARTKSGSLGVSGLDLTKPGTFVQAALGNPQIGARIAGAEGGGGIPLPNNLLARTGGVIGAATGGGPLVEETQGIEGLEDQGAIEGEVIPQEDNVGVGQPDQDKLRKAFLLMMLSNPKKASTLKTIFEFGFPKQTENVTKVSAKDAALAKTGLNNIQDVRKLFKKDPSVLTKQLIPGQFFSREFDSAVYDTADALLRIRTGAQANPSEIRGYMRKIAPTFGDSPDVVEYKLDKLERNFREILQAKGGANTIPVPAQGEF